MPFNNKHGWNVPWEVLNKMCGFFVSIGNPRWLLLQDIGQ